MKRFVLALLATLFCAPTFATTETVLVKIDIDGDGWQTGATMELLPDRAATTTFMRENGDTLDLSVLASDTNQKHPVDGATEFVVTLDEDRPILVYLKPGMDGSVSQRTKLSADKPKVSIDYLGRPQRDKTVQELIDGSSCSSPAKSDIAAKAVAGDGGIAQKSK